MSIFSNLCGILGIKQSETTKLCITCGSKPLSNLWISEHYCSKKCRNTHRRKEINPINDNCDHGIVQEGIISGLIDPIVNFDHSNTDNSDQSDSSSNFDHSNTDNSNQSDSSSNYSSSSSDYSSSSSDYSSSDSGGSFGGGDSGGGGGSI